jgi:hypothetical protein
MKATIEFDCNSAAFSEEEGGFEGELTCVLDQAERKLTNQYYRTPSLCTHDESDDVVFDTNGGRIGTITLKKDD